MEEKVIKQTVGKQALDLMQKDPEITSVVEQQRAMQEDYLKELTDCVMDYRKIWADNFFVVVLTKSEKLMPNVFRNYFVPRTTCPTPNYDQSVYRYDRAKEEIEFIWTIPCKEACLYLKENALAISPDEKDLFQFVMAFSDGTLYHLCRHLNKELDQSLNVA